MTNAELQHLRSLCERATPGPWRAIHGRGSGTVQAKDCAIYINVRRSEDEYLDETVARWQRDAAFIAAARSAVPALIEECERLQRERRDIDKDRDHLLTLLTDAHAGLYHLNRGERVEWSVPDLIARIAEGLDQ